MLRDPAHVIALSAGAGLSIAAPGTFGTLAAFPVHWWLASRFSDTTWLIVLGAAFFIGIWACGRTGRALGTADHGAMVWDETVAFALVLVFTPNETIWRALAFFLFRVFDIGKPPPIRYYDRTLKNGFGVMFDDLIAAFYTLICLALLRHVAT